MVKYLNLYIKLCPSCSHSFLNFQYISICNIIILRFWIKLKYLMVYYRPHNIQLFLKGSVWLIKVTQSFWSKNPLLGSIFSNFLYVILLQWYSYYLCNTLLILHHFIVVYQNVTWVRHFSIMSNEII